MNRFLFTTNLAIKYLYETIFAVLILFSLNSLTANAQTPFTTDDADVTGAGKFHFELLNEYDLLQHSIYPNLRQNTVTSRLAYGLVKDVEIGVDVPVVTILNAPGTVPQHPFGFSDTSLHLKAKLSKEKKTSPLPALAAGFYVRFPTGNPANSLGSGVTNYLLYGVAQKSISEKTKVRVNAGVLFAGNTVTGVLGIKTAKGKLFAGGLSVVKEYTEKLKLGIELNSVVSGNFQLSRGQLQTTLGGNYLLRRNLTFDFGFLLGRFPASPRAGGLIGFTVDF